MPKKKVARRKPETLPARFEPRFWGDCDGRSLVAREIRQRYNELRTDTGCDSAQKDLLVQRAVFISVQLETMEVDAMKGRDFDVGRYTQAVNTLLGLLRTLGLEKYAKPVGNLQDYVKQRGNGR